MAGGGPVSTLPPLGDGRGGRLEGEHTVGLVRLRGGGVWGGLCDWWGDHGGGVTPARPDIFCRGVMLLLWERDDAVSPGNPAPLGLKKLVLEPWWCGGSGGEGSQSRDCVASYVSRSMSSVRPCDILLYALPTGLRTLDRLLSV